jgi:hypothetical protein
MGIQIVARPRVRRWCFAGSEGLMAGNPYRTFNNQIVKKRSVEAGQGFKRGRAFNP